MRTRVTDPGVSIWFWDDMDVRWASTNGQTSAVLLGNGTVYAVLTVTALRSAAAAADIELVWMDAPLDAGFSLIRQRRADAGLGWLMTSLEALPSPLDAMSLGAYRCDGQVTGSPGTYRHACPAAPG